MRDQDSVSSDPTGSCRVWFWFVLVTHIGHRTAAIWAVGHLAACGLVGTRWFLVWTHNWQDEKSEQTSTDQYSSVFRISADFYPTLFPTLLLTVIGYSGDLLQQWHVGITRLADAMLQVTYCVARATVEMIAAAHGLQTIKTANREYVKEWKFAVLTGNCIILFLQPRTQTRTVLKISTEWDVIRKLAGEKVPAVSRQCYYFSN